MVRVHFITGNKGNIGKSVWASGVVEYYRHHQKPLIVIDSDNDSRTLKSTYHDSKILVLSDDPIMAGQPDLIMTIAYEENQKTVGEPADILVDLPAGGEKAINQWIEECGLDVPTDSFEVDLIKWWVCDSDPSSIKLFEDSVKKYSSIKHIFLKNMGRSREYQWDAFNESKSIKSLCKKNSVSVVEIPVLTPTAINKLREEGIEMNQAVEDTKLEKVDIGTRLRVMSWLSRTQHLIENEILLGSEKEAKQAQLEAEQVQEVTASV
ncbi:MAG: hypothetical protein DCF15_06035 [Phormidesmis priestleyi]|uniref:CobQ/CobB/MinD/ParA nucleotide binding domain-containing protein n=1 Tax=Phormidesmis priestleyi TaxID=268141 RepID=A0A2W4ZT09_9CYAN|nr:MAG: hypothetical protein DCF15_06035 [Phormidesmis priestleyi]